MTQRFAQLKESLKEEDPFEVLRVSYQAGDEEIIRARDQLLMHNPQDQDRILLAYNRIRNKALRQEFRWSDLRWVFGSMPALKQVEKPSMEELIRELAFLSKWEAGAL